MTIITIFVQPGHKFKLPINADPATVTVEYIPPTKEEPMVSIVEAAFTECELAKKTLGKIAVSIKEMEGGLPFKHLNELTLSGATPAEHFAAGWSSALKELQERAKAVSEISSWEGW